MAGLYSVAGRFDEFGSALLEKLLRDASAEFFRVACIAARRCAKDAATLDVGDQAV